ncbi:papilin [Anoplophora glabripennis]|nr:papilin [Anoplophora glabripennis]
MPRGERFYFRHAATVVDGTRCNDEKLDVCVSGKCQPVGCDMMLGSNAREDLCRICGGNGSSCNTIQNTIPMKDMQVGYNDIILIPPGATNIRVEEVAPSNNYLAIRNSTGHYYLNGNWRIDFPRTMDFAGTKFHYDRSPQGFSAPDIIISLGPTYEALFIVLLYQDSDVPVQYTYSLPTNVVTGSEETYAWTFDEFTPCSKTCGGGYQFRNVTCAGRKTLDPVDSKLCNEDNEPEAKKKCNEIPCEAQWTPYPWGKCSAPCGEGGLQTREISCQQISGNGYPVLVDDSECLKLHPKPPTQQKCNEGKICAQWYSEPWKPCDHLCGDGKQSRKITCFVKHEDGKIEVLEDSECEVIEPKPEEERKCNVRPCEGVDWITSEWSGCDRICGLTNETRKVHCATASGQIYSDDLCEAEQKPETVRKCETSNTTCQYLWYASQWSECSVQCGEGIQTRTIFCGVSTVDGVKKVENEKCDPSKDFETIKKCVGEEEECEGEWFSGPWGKCTKPCGGGERSKKVVCLKDNEVVDPSICGSDRIVFSHEECNTHPCSEDTIMPTDITQSVDESETEKLKATVTSESTKESEPTSATDELFDVTTEQSDMITTLPEDDNDEYEIVPDTTCDDGEWVMSDEPLEKLEKLQVSKESVRTESSISSKLELSKETIGTEPPFSLDDLMLSDGTTITGDGESTASFSLETGSGESEITSSATEISTLMKSTGLSDSTDEEGSGTGSTIVIGTDTEITTEAIGQSSQFTPESTATSEISGSTEISVTTGESLTSITSSESDTTNISEASSFTTESIISGSTEILSTTQFSSSESTETVSSSDITTNTIDVDVTTESLGSSKSDDTTESVSSDFTTISSDATISSTSVSDNSVSTDNTVNTEITESGTSDTTESSVTESTDSTEITESSTDSTETTESSTDSTETTEGSTDSTETTESTDSTESSVSTDNTDTTETTYLTETSESSLNTESTDISDVTTEISASTSESIISSEYSTDETSTIFFIGESDLGARKPTTASSGTDTTLTDEDTTEFTTSSAITGSSESPESTVAITEITSTESSESTDGKTTIFSDPTESGSTGGTSEIGSTEATVEFTSSTFRLESSSEITTGYVTDISTSATIEDGSTEATTQFTSSTSELSGSSEITTESSVSVGQTYSTTEIAESVATDSTESTIEFTSQTTGAVTDTDIFGITTETEGTETTTYEIESTTPIIEIFKSRPKMCKRRKIKACKKTQYGCCWDNITPAEGPFDKGCPTPRTCKESKFGCCEDGISAALGTKYAGCPTAHCNETLFGCCRDNKTASQGNNNEGCPQPPPECLKSKFGCCDDNVTEAKGPKHKGCIEEEPEETETSETPEITESTEPTKEMEIKEDCKNTTYRCCPDGVTAAEGPGYRGCNLPCSNSTFGCCQDGTTSAHGPSGEGCCLISAFGCCPDNVVPARGPNLDGCGCQYSPYGCCPDNSTSARGYNDEGCGCQYTTYGCCPDSFTPANGPNYEGCLCHTFQFGCCPDGITAARGPHQQGCGCRNTEFGCCSDEQTPAFGPNKEGCGCVSSKFGCCVDGVTEAKGENFEGCETAPENLQASCSLPKERGTCRNYTVKWFFDMDYGGCSRFWYGGCDGNGNRYKTKEECDQVCVIPQGPDRCNLPKVAGPCEGYYPQWYYDKDAKNCAQFIYGGCLGNNNKFETREECMGLCVKDSSVDACEQPKEEGPCRGQYQRYYYHDESDQCQPFIYGGCKGNNNNFPTIEACSQKCAAPGRKKDHCSLPRAQGNCTEKLSRWYYDTPEKRCVPFYYSGCNGNQNNFDSKEACENDCPMDIVKDTCHLPAETGECGNYVDRWYYDTKQKACQQFYYGGCGGNENNFETQQRCQARCEQDYNKSQEPTSQPHPSESPQTVTEAFRTDMCFLPSDPGPCRNGTVRYYYDRSDGVCKSFTFGGCHGNRNNFISVEECLQYCGTSQDLCTLPPVVGPCNGEYTQYYYDSFNDSCLPFTFGGCGGNYNRFQDQSSCEQRCRKAPPSQVVSTQAPPAPPTDIAMCYQLPDPGNCTENYVAFFFDTNTRKCTPFTYTGCGGNDNRFNSEEQCERQCGSFRGQDVCNMEKDSGPCRGYFVKYYYEKSEGRCEQFAFGGCQGNGNRFSSNEECEHICVTHEETKPNITSTAVPEVEVTDVPQHPCQEMFDECTTLKCAYGVEAYVDENECNRCQCKDPCRNVECLEDEQCAIDINRNKTSDANADFIAICRQSNKPGTCPTLEPSETNCEQECNSDADCTLHLKCCSTGCGTACVDPVLAPQQLNTQMPIEPAYTEKPHEIGLQPPKVDSQIYKPEVSALIGDQAVLKCAVTGNPNPKIKWSRDNFEIDGTQPRYRIKLDQSLQIITLHKTDSGIYLCTADNSIGEPITNQIKLEVVDSEPRPATILDQTDEPPVVVSLNAPTTLNCFVLGYPFPSITWWKEDNLIPLKNNEFEVRKDHSLLIHSVKLHNLGIYTCQAYNGVGKAASWAVSVKARGPYHFADPAEFKYKQYIVNPPEEPTTVTRTTTTPQPPRFYVPYRPTPEPYVPPTSYPEPSNEIVPEPVPPPDTGVVLPSVVPIRANITTNDQRYPVGSDIQIPCEVVGYPEPQVQWYKDGVPLNPSDRIAISDSHTLTILKVTKADSGYYQCEAVNNYSKASSTLEILIEGMYIHPSCTDNQFFANCALIVKAKFCSHKYYAKFCCRSCTEAGLLPVDGPHLPHFNKIEALNSNLV